MIHIRKANDRGHADHGWLNTYHTFSFADYYDPAHMGFRALRVINEDFVQPGNGFGTHSHSDMEIITNVLAGTLEHKDSLGTGSLIRPGELQRMTAGIGVRHSESNPSSTEAVHLYQIWLLPERRGLSPSYEQKRFDPAERQGKLRLVASRDGREGSLTVHQDVGLYLASLNKGEQVVHELQGGRFAWLQLVSGAVELNGEPLAVSDGAAVNAEAKLTLRAVEPAEVMLFDLA